MGETTYSEWLNGHVFDEEWIHAEVPDREWNAIFEEIEMALGFRLFIWQKHYIMTGKFRCYGATTAQVLRDLIVDVDAEPLNFRKIHGLKDVQYECELGQIKRKLDAAGIPTRRIYFGQGVRHRDISGKNEEQPSISTRYIDYVYNILKDNTDKFDRICMDYIIDLVGLSGLDELINNHLVESCGTVDGRKLYALLDKK